MVRVNPPSGSPSSSYPLREEDAVSNQALTGLAAIQQLLLEYREGDISKREFLNQAGIKMSDLQQLCSHLPAPLRSQIRAFCDQGAEIDLETLKRELMTLIHTWPVAHPGARACLNRAQELLNQRAVNPPLISQAAFIGHMQNVMSDLHLEKIPKPLKADVNYLCHSWQQMTPERIFECVNGLIQKWS